MSVHILGIRHHGPGSARSVRQSLDRLQPDIILIEGPPEAESVLPLSIHPEMQPPVALLIYAVEDPHQSVYYPFAIFSPEWQALQYGLTQHIPVRFMDLPQTHRFAQSAQDPSPSDDDPDNEDQDPDDNSPNSDDDPQLKVIAQERLSIRQDPLGWLARAAGYPDGERWWEQMVEQRQDPTDVFEAILEAMTALRQEAAEETDPIEQRREAYMRKTLRAAEKEGFETIAVICGAWHAPALIDRPPVKQDNALLKGLPKCKVTATWVPWTYGRLSRASGYGAGILSPGWYHCLWSHPHNSALYWITQVARYLREQDLDASSASVIEAVRLAESLAILRDQRTPSLDELTAATQTVLCFGDPGPMRLVSQTLIVGEQLGEIPDATPMVPLQQDLARLQKRLKLKPEAESRFITLDLRDTQAPLKSHLLHRLNLLGVPWGRLEESSGKGTFKEAWTLQWHPEFAVTLIEMGGWGNTVEAAATTYTQHRAQQAPDLPSLTGLVNDTLLANLPAAVTTVIDRLQSEAAVASDITHLMAAISPLADVLRYSDVRQTETSIIQHVIDGLILRTCIGLPGSCQSLNDDAAQDMEEYLSNVHQAILLLNQTDHTDPWFQTLRQLSDQPSLHGLLAGRCCRFLLDVGHLTTDDVAGRMSYALSIASDPAQSAAWVEGLLKGSGLLLLHDANLWAVMDQWISELPTDSFTTILPLMRRTFATFAPAERRQMGERIRHQGSSVQLSTPEVQSIDVARADPVLPMVARLLGLAVG